MEDKELPLSMPETRWSLVEQAASGQTIVRRAALNELLQRYMPALRAHLVLEKRIAAERVDDLLQGFVAEKILDKWILGDATASRGRFRNFLLTALDNYIVSQHRYAQTTIRGSGKDVSLDAVGDVEGREPNPAEQFDVLWASQLLEQAIAVMETQCKDVNRMDIWQVFESRVLAPLSGDHVPPTYGELAAAFTLKTPTHAINLVITGKRMFARILRSLILEYEKTDAVDEELDDLYRILKKPRII
jgi:DNA-directed RNA polymerase specialized sigma24 family protein